MATSLARSLDKTLREMVCKYFADKPAHSKAMREIEEIRVANERTRELAEKLLEADAIGKQSVREQIRTKRLFYDVIATVPDLVWTLDENGKFVLTNTSFRETFMLRLNYQQCLGKTFEELVSGEAINDFVKLFAEEDREIVSTGIPGSFVEAGTVRGKHLTLYTKKRPRYDVDGRFIGIVCSASDVTQLMQYACNICDLLASAKNGGDPDHSILTSALSEAENFLVQSHFGTLLGAEGGRSIRIRGYG